MAEEIMDCDACYDECDLAEECYNLDDLDCGDCDEDCDGCVIIECDCGPGESCWICEDKEE